VVKVRRVWTRKFSGNGKLKQTPEQERIADLKGNSRMQKLERDILKKAIGIFSKTVDDLCFH
jgi:transposase